MKNNLTGSLLHQKLQRAYPQGTFPETTLDVLAKYPENTDIDAKELTANERDIFIDLATAGLIEMHRYPKFSSGMFAGFVVSYRYRKNLDYGPNVNSIADFEKKRKETLLIGIAIGFAVTIAGLCIIDWILK